MHYQKKIYCLQPDTDDTNLAICKLDKRTGKYKPLHKVTESRYKIMITQRELYIFKQMMIRYKELWDIVSVSDFFQFEYDMKKFAETEVGNDLNNSRIG